MSDSDPNEEWDFKWKEIVHEGNMLFDYMSLNFESMISDDHINHVHMIYGTGLVSNINIRGLLNKYNYEIQSILIPWIMNERISGRLFNKCLWKPFRRLDDFFDMYLGYKRTFKFKGYTFLLGMSSYCDYYCKDCKPDDKSPMHFCLALYSGTEEDVSLLKISEDDMLHGTFWECE